MFEPSNGSRLECRLPSTNGARQAVLVIERHGLDLTVEATSQLSDWSVVLHSAAAVSAAQGCEMERTGNSWRLVPHAAVQRLGCRLADEAYGHS